MALLKKISGLLLLLGLAAVFIISGWSKLGTIDPFTWSFLDILPIGMTTASIIARLFIGLEWLIAGWLIAHLFLRSFTYQATICFLILLSLYLVGLLIKQGNHGNCGCFGEWLYMSPVAALWKNAVLIAVAIILWFLYPSRQYSQQLYVALAITMAAFSLPFIIRPVLIHSSGKAAHRFVNLDPVYQNGVPTPEIDLKKGKHIICYFSTTCPHCKKGAFLVQILHRQYPEFPIFMVLNGSKVLEQSFFSETKSQGVPHTLMVSTPAFTSMAGEYVPVIYWVNNSIVERESYYTELEPSAIKKWLTQ